MKHSIGLISQKIHKLVCSSEKPLTISYLVGKLKHDPRKVMVALGWLYRSGLIELEERNFRIYITGKRCGKWSGKAESNYVELKAIHRIRRGC